MSKKKASKVSIRPVDRVKKQKSKEQQVGQPGCDCGDCGCTSSTVRRTEKAGDVTAVKKA